MKKVVLILLLLFPLITYGEEVEFNKCVDGDTFKITLNDEVKSVRMLAIDTPESVHPTKKVEAYGIESSKYTCELLTNASKIELEYDNNSDKTDKYGRILAWVFVDDELLQDILIKKGYAEVAYLYGNYKYTDLLKDHEEVAKSQELGIWSNETNDNNELIVIAVVIGGLIITYLKKKLKKVIRKSKININLN